MARPEDRSVTWPDEETIRRASRGESPRVFALADNLLALTDTYPAYFDYRVDEESQHSSQQPVSSHSPHKPPWLVRGWS